MNKKCNSIWSSSYYSTYILFDEFTNNFLNNAINEVSLGVRNKVFDGIKGNVKTAINHSTDYNVYTFLRPKI